MTPRLTAIIITKNEAPIIAGCLKSLSFCDEIIVVDTGNTDTTNAIAKKFGANIVPCYESGYAAFRNCGLREVRAGWVLFVDADERVTPELASEITHTISVASAADVYLLPRKNNYLGRFMQYGGWGGERLPRLFRRKALKRYTGDLHEQPEYTGQVSELSQPLLHFSHRDLSTMVEKTIRFTDTEARLRVAAQHPPMATWRLFRVMGTEAWYRFVKQQAFRDGIPGVIDGLFQIYNAFIIYSRLWELQHAHSKSSHS